MQIPIAVKIDKYTFIPIPVEDRFVFRIDELKLPTAKKIQLMASVLIKSYDGSYLNYIINSNIPTFLIKPEYITYKDT